jgi:hypothetical protein
MVLWSVLLPGLRRVVPIAGLARFMWTDPRGIQSDERQQAIVEFAGRVTRLRRGRNANCLERSLIAYRFLSGAGARPQLVLGVGRTDDRVVGHAWVTVGDEPVFETTEVLSDFAPIAVFGSRGTRLGAGSNGPLPREWC